MDTYRSQNYSLCLVQKYVYVCLLEAAGYPQQQPTVPPPGSYPTGQQLLNQSAETPPDYKAGKFIVRSYYMQ